MRRIWLLGLVLSLSFAVRPPPEASAMGLLLHVDDWPITYQCAVDGVTGSLTS